MKVDQIRQLLELLKAKVPHSQPRTGWVLSNCPLGPWKHNGGKSLPTAFGVKVETGDPFCNCFSCGFHGSLTDLVMEVRQHNKASPIDTFSFGEALQLIAIAEEEMPDFDAPGIEDVLLGGQGGLHEYPKWWLESFPTWYEVPFSKTYLSQRAVPEVVSNALDIRADPNQKRVCFPVRDFQGILRGLQGRACLEATEPRYRMYVQAGKKNPIVWLGEAWVNPEKPIVVVEGPFDLARVYQVYRNVVSPLYSNPNAQKIKRMSDAFEWITLLDRGTGGDTGRQKIDDELGKTHIVTHLLPDEGCKDPADMPVHNVAALLDPYVKLDDILLV
jgi:5S rRNA maturation endonuclease (ribonuclease M5)